MPLAAELRPLCVGKEDVDEAVESLDSGLLHVGGTTVVPISVVCTLSVKIQQQNIIMEIHILQSPTKI